MALTAPEGSNEAKCIGFVGSEDHKPAVLTCPGCEKKFVVCVCNVTSATADCPNEECGMLLLIEDGKVYDFHKKLHERDPRWPADGKGTEYIEF